MARQLMLLLVVITLAGVGCSSKSEASNGPLPPEGPARVEVTNNNWLDMSVYALNGGKRVRLGLVTTLGTEMFEVPDSFLASSGSLQLLASPIGASGSYVTEHVSIWPGQTVQFRIENNLGTSNVSVR